MEKRSITWSQYVDQALCYGWTEVVRKSIDSEVYYQISSKGVFITVNLIKTISVSSGAY